MNCLSILFSATFVWMTRTQFVSSAMNPIVIKGNLLYDSVTKERFYIKGVTYDPIPNCIDGGTDVLADDYPLNPWEYGSQWVDWRAELEDIAKLNVNTVRIYQTDPHKTHTQFMQHAENLGLYVVAPLTGSDFGKLDGQVSSPACYSGDLGKNLLWFARSVVKEYSKYPNTLMLASGNEIFLWSNSGHSFPCLKALIRDLHSWQTGCGVTMRRVPLVYAMQDRGSPEREYIGDYLTSMKETEDDVLDIFGINAYVYCREFWPWNPDSPLYQLNEVYKHYAAPFVITEFGCQQLGVDSRKYNNIDQMMTEMQETTSGGFVYEYSQHVKPWDNKGFGLVETMASTCQSSTVRTWYENAYVLQGKYNQTAFRAYNNRFGNWTDEDRCSWKPPSTLEHKRPDFPWNIVDWGYDNWNDALPPTPDEWPVVSCPDFELSITELKENICHGSDIHLPTLSPTLTLNPSLQPTHKPSLPPTELPTVRPSDLPSSAPAAAPTPFPTYIPSPVPSHYPQALPEASPLELSGLTIKQDPNSEKQSSSSSASSASVAVIVIVLAAILASISLLFAASKYGCQWFDFLDGSRSKSKRMTEVQQYLRRVGLVRGNPSRGSESARPSVIRRLVVEKRLNEGGGGVGCGGDSGTSEPSSGNAETKENHERAVEMKQQLPPFMTKDVPPEVPLQQTHVSTENVISTHIDFV